MGVQIGFNLATGMDEDGMLEKQKVDLIGGKLDRIGKDEERLL